MLARLLNWFGGTRSSPSPTLWKRYVAYCELTYAHITYKEWEEMRFCEFDSLNTRILNMDIFPDGIGEICIKQGEIYCLNMNVVLPNLRVLRVTNAGLMGVENAYLLPNLYLLSIEGNPGFMRPTVKDLPKDCSIYTGHLQTIPITQ